MNLTQKKLLEELELLTKSERIKLSEGVVDLAYRGNLASDGQLLPVSTIPLIINQKVITGVHTKLDILTEALVLLETYAFSAEGKPVYDRLLSSLSDKAQEIIEYSQYESDFSLQNRHRRIDIRMNPHTGDLSVLRINQTDPVGVSRHDTMLQIGGTVLDTIGFSFQDCGIAESLLLWFIEEFQQRNPEQFPTSIALVVEHGQSDKLTDLPMIAEKIVELCRDEYQYELQIMNCYPSDISLWDSAMWLGDDKIDMIWRNTEYMTMYNEDKESVEDFISICNNSNDHLVINSARGLIAESMESFVLLSDPHFVKILGLSQEKAEVLQDIITEVVNPFYSKELISNIIAEKEEWHSLFSDKRVSTEIEYGYNHTVESWSDLVHERSLNKGFVFQRNVAHSNLELWDIDHDGDLINQVGDVEFSSYHVNGKFSDSLLAKARVQVDGEMFQGSEVRLLPVKVV